MMPFGIQALNFTVNRACRDGKEDEFRPAMLFRGRYTSDFDDPGD